MNLKILKSSFLFLLIVFLVGCSGGVFSTNDSDSVDVNPSEVDQSIRSFSVEYDAESDRLQASLTTTGDFVRRQFLFNNDDTPATGFDGGYDYLLENGNLYRYTGAAGSTQWSWEPLEGAVTGSLGDQAYEDSVVWSVSLNDRVSTNMPYAIRVEVTDDKVEEATGVATSNEATGQLTILEAEAVYSQAKWNLAVRFNTIGNFDRRLALIDSDNNASTGYQGGADYLLENGNLYAFNGEQASEWKWIEFGGVTGSIGDTAFENQVEWVFSLPTVLANAPVRFVAERDATDTDPGEQVMLNSAVVGVPLDNDPETVTLGPYQPDDDLEIFPNPDRGLYLYSRFNEGGSLTWSGDSLLDQRNAGRTLVLLLVDLDSEVGNRSLSQPLLDALGSTLQRIGEAGFKVIFRARYKHDESDVEEPELDDIANHIEQLAGVINANKSAVAYIEAGMIGKWGEWNTSRYIDLPNPSDPTDNTPPTDQEIADNSTAVLSAWLEAAPDFFIGVRRPRFKTSANLNDDSRIAHYNDCFLRNAKHEGTYQPGFEGRAFLQSGDTENVPIGGENCGLAGYIYRDDASIVISYQYAVDASGNAYPSVADPAEDIDEYAPNPEDVVDICNKGQQALTDYRFTYLNHRLNVDEPLTSKTNANSWWPRLWLAGECWDDIERSLGYRFDLETVELSGSLTLGGTLNVAVSVENEGYARLYNSRDVALVFIDAAGDIAASQLLSGLDANRWLPGQTTTQSASITIPANLTPGDYSLGLQLADPTAPSQVKHALRFANSGWQEEIGVQVFADAAQGNSVPLSNVETVVVAGFNDGDLSLFDAVTIGDTSSDK